MPSYLFDLNVITHTYKGKSTCSFAKRVEFNCHSVVALNGSVSLPLRWEPQRPWHRVYACSMNGANCRYMRMSCCNLDTMHILCIGTCWHSCLGETSHLYIWHVHAHCAHMTNHAITVSCSTCTIIAHIANLIRCAHCCCLLVASVATIPGNADLYARGHACNAVLYQ